MTLRTALVIGGDTSEAQREVQALTGDVQELATASQRAAAPGRDLAVSQGAIASSARNATGAVGGLYQAWQSNNGAAGQVAVTYGALAPVIDDTAKKATGLGGSLTQVNVIQAIAREGSEALASTLAGALAGGIAGVVAGAIGLVAQLTAEAYAADQANTASARLADALKDLDEAQKRVAVSARQEAAAHLANATAKVEDAIRTRQLIQAQAAQAKADADRNLKAAGNNGLRGGDLAIQRASSSGSESARLQAEITKQDEVIATLRKTQRLAAIPVLQGRAAGDLDAATAAINRADDAIARLDGRFKRGEISGRAYREEYTRLKAAQDAATASAGGNAAATERSTRANTAGAGASSSHAAATGALAQAQRELAADLSGVIARYDPAKKAAADYAVELERIKRLESAGEGKGGISKADADRYRVAAESAYLKGRGGALSLPDVDATAAASAAIDKLVSSLRGEIAILGELDPLQREMLRYRDELAKLAPEERAAREAEIRDLVQLKLSTADMADAARDAADSKRQLLDAARGALDAIIVGGEKAGDVVDRLARSIASAAIEAGVFGTGPLAGVLNGAIGGGGTKKASSPFNAGVNAAAEAAGLNKAVEKGTASALDRVFGTGGKFTTTLKNAGYGSVASSLTGGSAGSGAIGGAIGGAVATKFLSSALGSFAGPLGSIAGGILGGVIGGLFAPKAKPGGVTVSNVGGSAAIGGNVGSDRQGIQVGTGLGGSVASQLNAIAKQLNGSIGQFSVQIGKYKDDLRVNVNGRPLGGVKGSGATGFGSDEGAAVNFAVAQALAQGGIKGVSDAVAKAIRSSPNVEAALQEAMKVQELETLLGGISGQAERAFSDFAAVAKERVRIAQEYGFDVVAIEKRNAEDRAKIAADLAKAQTGSLQQLLDEMQRGSLFEGSSIDRIAALNTAIAKAQTDLDAGVEGAGDVLAKLLQDRLGALKDAYGTTGGYATGRAETESQARAAIAAANARIAAAQTKSDPALKVTNDKLDEIGNQGSEMASYLRSIDTTLAGIGGGGGNFQTGFLNASQLALY